MKHYKHQTFFSYHKYDTYPKKVENFHIFFFFEKENFHMFFFIFLNFLKIYSIQKIFVQSMRPFFEQEIRSWNLFKKALKNRDHLFVNHIAMTFSCWLASFFPLYRRYPIPNQFEFVKIVETRSLEALQLNEQFVHAK